MTGPVVVLGAGGHAKVVINALLLTGVRPAGCVDPRRELWGANVLGVPVWGGEGELEGERVGPGVCLANGIGSVGRGTARRDAFQRFKGRGFAFITVRHPSAIVAEGVALGEGVQVMAGAILQPGSSIGGNSIVNTGASVDHDCRIGSHVHIAPGAVLSGEVIVGDEAHVGTGAVVKQGVRVGRGSVVAAGAAVIEDVPDGIVVGGVPARRLRAGGGAGEQGEGA